MATPTVTSVNPGIGVTTGGTPVTITGTNLTGTTTVTFGGTPATNFTVNSNTQISATTPPHPAGTALVAVTTPAGTSTSSVSFFYLAPTTPTITSVSPNNGPTTGGTPVTITGTNLTGTTTVTFGGTPATNFTVNSNTQISATTPPHPAGTALVAVTTPAGTSNAAQYFYINAPTINSLSPTIGPETGGNPVVIDGTDLAPVTATSFGVVSASFSVTNGNEILAIAPSGTSFVQVAVVSPGGLSNSIFYNYVPAPVITGLSPGLGPEAGGNQVTINGTDVGLVSAVFFGVEPASFAALSDSQVLATAPAGTGTTHVVLTTPGGTSTGLAYTYVAPP
ncbi:MAG: IPT/TIG domain-containing protein [Pseudonocardiaceae bacterium]